MISGALIVSVVFVGVVSARKEIEPPLDSNSEEPVVVPMVKALMAVAAAPKLILPMFSGLLSVMAVVLLDRNVAVSALLITVADVVPGKVFAPVLQLFSPPVAAQLPSVGVALHVAEAAKAEGTAPHASIIAMIAMTTRARCLCCTRCTERNEVVIKVATDDS